MSKGAPPAKLVNGANPVFRMVTICCALVVLENTEPKSSEKGLTVSSGPTPVPCSVMLNGPALVDELEVVVNAPAAAGVKVKKYWQLPPGATPPAQFWEP